MKVITVKKVLVRKDYTRNSPECNWSIGTEQPLRLAPAPYRATSFAFFGVELTIISNTYRLADKSTFLHPPYPGPVGLRAFPEDYSHYL